MDRANIGQQLLRAKLLTDAQLKQAEGMRKQVGGNLGSIIVKLGLLTDDQLTRFISEQERLPVVDLSTQVIPKSLVKRVPKEVLERHQVIPVHMDHDVLTLAMADPTDFEAIEEIQFLTNCRVHVALASRAAIAKALNHFRTDEERAREDLIKELDQPATRQAPLEVSPGLEQALIPLLIAKGVITEEELRKKARELGVLK